MPPSHSPPVARSTSIQVPLMFEFEPRQNLLPAVPCAIVPQSPHENALRNFPGIIPDVSSMSTNDDRYIIQLRALPTKIGPKIRPRGRPLIVQKESIANRRNRTVPFSNSSGRKTRPSSLPPPMIRFATNTYFLRKRTLPRPAWLSGHLTI